MEVRDMWLFGELSLSCLDGMMVVETTLEWVEAWVGGKEIVSSDNFPRVRLWCEGEEEIRMMGSFLSVVFVFFKIWKISLNVIGKEPIKGVHS